MLKAFSHIVGYQFKDEGLLDAALTHPSLHRGQSFSAFERLEFLGDRVLGLAIATLLYQRFPEEPEGPLAWQLSSLCSKKQLVAISRLWRVPEFLKSAGLQSDADNALADAVEAVLGAVYLDGGLEAVMGVIKTFWHTDMATLSQEPDAKSRLQHTAQGAGFSLPTYCLISKEGPEHAPIFMVEASACGHSATASAHNKKEAEQRAAEKVLEQLKNDL